MFTKRSSYKIIEDGDSLPPESGATATPANLTFEDDDALLRNTEPPRSHEITSVSFEGGNNKYVDSSLHRSNSSNVRRWDHIEDVDHFFALIYKYYHGHGFLCITTKLLCALLQFLFVVFFPTFWLQCIDYDVLFNKNRNITTKRYISNVVIDQCASNLHPVIVVALIFASVFFAIHLIRSLYYLVRLLEIRAFFSDVLKINDTQLNNVSWSEVVDQLCAVQKQLHIVINQDHITALDVYQRILRYQNYFTALVYTEVLPLRIRLPFMNSFHYLPKGLRVNLDWLLFWGPYSPWKSSYALKDDFKDPSKMAYLANEMRTTLLWMSIVNLAFLPFVFLYQILFIFFSLLDMVKRDPNTFGTRRYSNYGREKLRHYNELDHELVSRLNRSYKFASRYMDQFVSPVIEVIAKFFAFIAVAFFAVIAALSAWDEDVLTIQHVITVMTVAGIIAKISWAFISKENVVYCQDFLMQQIVANIHYAPQSWIKNSQTADVYTEFCQLFQLKIQYFFEEIFSSLFTPFILYFHVREHCSELVLFFHSNTQYIEGLGDVCTFAQMNIERDGDPRLTTLIPISSSGKRSPNDPPSMTAVSGKTELSLVNFSKQNPKWIPTKNNEKFLKNIQETINDHMLNMSSTFLEIGGVLFPPSNNIMSSQMPSEFNERQLRDVQMSASALAINNSLLLSNMNNSGLASTIVGKNTRGFSSNSGRDKNVFNSGSTFQSQSQDLVTEQYLRGSIAETNSTREIHLPLLIAANSGIQLPMGSSRGQAQQNITESIGRYGALGADNNTDSLAASNIWGVPANNELSHIRIEQSILEEEDDL